MSDPVKVVIDCSATGAPSAEVVAQIEADALQLLRDGKVDEAAIVMQSVQAAADAASLTAEAIVPLTAEEIAQRDIDRAAADKQAQAAAAAATEQATLVAKLAKGSATSTEIQQALAQLLG